MSGPSSIKTIVIVEDRGTDLDFITATVRDAFGANVAIHSARTLATARTLLATRTPDLVILDLHLPDGTGADLIPFVRQKHGDVWVVVVTVFDDDEHLFTALRQGCDGYLLKDESRTSAAEILKDVLAGHPPLSARVARRVLKFVQASTAQAPTQPAHPDLTPREREVLVLLARGHTIATAAGELGISEHTAKSHVKNLYRKLDVSTRAGLVRTALDEGLA